MKRLPWEAFSMARTSFVTERLDVARILIEKFLDTVDAMRAIDRSA
jgi:hypothetical protein